MYDKRYAKHNFRIHDYFFGKALDKVRPGGIVAFVTSKGTLDKANSSVRKYIAERAELIGAVRLPNTAFRDSAGTDVTSDILFLQKREQKTVVEPDWVHLGKTEDGIPVNSYFVEHPEMMLGKMEYDTRMFGNESRYTSCVNHDENFGLKSALSKAVSNLKGRITDVMELADTEEQSKDMIEANPDVKNYTFTFVEGKLYYRENSVMYRREVSVSAEERIRLMDEIRTITRQLIFIQAEGRKELYDDILALYGEMEQSGRAEGSKNAINSKEPEVRVAVTPFEREGSNIRGLVRICFEDSFIVNNASVIKGKEKEFVSMPSYLTSKSGKDGKGQYQDICFPVTKEFRQKLYDAVLECYRQEKEKVVAQRMERDSSQKFIKYTNRELPVN